jgi:hypothetical protein
MSYDSEKIRLQFQLGVVANTTDAQTAIQGDAWRRTNWRFELSFARNSVIQDVSNFASLRLLVMPNDDRTGAALLDRTTDQFTPVVADADWLAESDQQAVIEFTADETNLDLGDASSKTFYVVALVETVDGKFLVAGFAELTVYESGAWKDSQQPAQGGNIIPGGATYDGDGEYALSVAVGKLYSFTKGANDDAYDNGGGDITEDGNFTAAGAGITLKGTADAAVTAIVRSLVYITADQADARYLTHRFNVTQAGHGFAKGDAIRFNGTSYVKAQANSPANAEVFGIVEFVAGDVFIVVTSGKIAGLSGLTPGEVYFLSGATAGALVEDEPETVGHVSKPVLLATSATGGMVLHYRGVEIVEAESSEATIGDNIFNEVPAGLVNSANAVFTTSNDYIANSARVYLNGIRQRPGGSFDFTETGANTITFNAAPQTGDTIIVDYIKA